MAAKPPLASELTLAELSNMFKDAAAVMDTATPGAIGLQEVLYGISKALKKLNEEKSV